MGARTFRQVVGYQNLEELTTKVNGFFLQFLKNCLDLPAKVYQRRGVELTLNKRKFIKN